jgi:hypothetical protein
MRSPRRNNESNSNKNSKMTSCNRNSCTCYRYSIKGKENKKPFSPSTGAVHHEKSAFTHEISGHSAHAPAEHFERSTCRPPHGDSTRVNFRHRNEQRTHRCPGNNKKEEEAAGKLNFSQETISCDGKDGATELSK